MLRGRVGAPEWLEAYADALVNTIKTNAGRPYSRRVMSNYLSTAYNQASMLPQVMASRSPNVTEYFEYALAGPQFKGKLTPGGEQAKRKIMSLKHDMFVLATEQLNKEGKKDGRENVPTCKRQIKEINQQYALEGSQGSADRALAIAAGWLTVGRGGESGTMSFHLATWHPGLQQLGVDMSEKKRSKFKLVCFMAGKSRHLCMFSSLGMAYMFPPNSEIQDIPFMIPSQPGSVTLSTFLQAMEPEPSTPPTPPSSSSSGNAQRTVTDALSGGSGVKKKKKKKTKYSGYSVPDLQRINSSSLRHATIDLVYLYMALEHVLVSTGHQMQTKSALFEYIGIGISALQAASVVLHDWPPFPFGQHGPGSVPASWGSLGLLGEDTEKVHDFVSQLFWLSFRPQLLRRGGRLYQFTLAVAAQNVMHYAERTAAGEFASRAVHMQECYNRVFKPNTVGRLRMITAHRDLETWSKKVTAQWKIDNVHLTERQLTSTEANAEFVDVLKGFGEYVTGV